MASRLPDFEGLLARLTTVLDRRGVPFMLIGGQAVLLHGDPRLTQGRRREVGTGPGTLERRRRCVPRDLEDAASVVRRKGPELDWDYMREWVEAFAQVEGREPLTTQLKELRSA